MAQFRYRLSPRGHGFRWLLVALYGLLMFGMVLGQGVIIYALPALAREFGFSHNGGALLILVFGLTFGITPMFAGVVLDRLGARRPVICALGVAIFSLLLFSGAIGHMALLASRALLGVAAGLLVASTVRIVADWFSLHERGLAFSLLFAPVPLGIALAPLVLPSALRFLALTGVAEWRLLSLVLALLMAIGLALWIRFYRDDPSRSPNVSARELAQIGRRPIPRRRRSRYPTATTEKSLHRVHAALTVSVNGLAFFTVGYTLFFALVWLPDRLLTQGDWDSLALDYLEITPWLTGSVGLLLGGLASDGMLRRAGWLRAARSRIAIWCAVFALILILVALVLPGDIAAGARFTLLIACCLVALVFTALPPLLATNVDILRRTPTVWSGVMFTIFVAAALLAPSVSQRLASLGGSGAYPMLLVAGLNFLMVSLTHAFHRPDDCVGD